MKKFYNWTVNCTSIEEKNIRYNNFIDVWICMSKIYTGDCLREYQHQYLEEKRISAPARNPHECCTWSQIKSAIPLEPSDKLVLLVQTLFLLKVIDYILSCASLSHNLYFHSKVNQIARVYEKKVVDWMSGAEENWVWFHFNCNNTEEVTYGCLRELP